MIAVILPTRGMVFTEVEKAIELERSEFSIGVFRSSNLPIPHGHNELSEIASQLIDVTHLWFLEEDTIPPTYALHNLLATNSDIACIDYGVNGWSCITKEKTTKEILYCGMGCTLIKREVFETLEKPWFRSDKMFRINDGKWIDVDPSKQYGLQDIWFCAQARHAGFRIVQVPGECRHLKLKALGQSEINSGLHIIEEKPQISKHNEMEYF